MHACRLSSSNDRALRISGKRFERFALSAALVVGILLSLATLARAQNSSSNGQSDAAAQEFRWELRALNWIAGPQQVQMFGVSSLQIPKGYLFLGTADTTKLQALLKDIGSGNQYFFAPKDFHWQVFFSYRADGYVKDDEAIDADAILKNIRDNTERTNQERRERARAEGASADPGHLALDRGTC